jgi:hypothetical protein
MILDKMGGQGNITKTRLTRLIFVSNTNEHQIPANVTHYCNILKKINKSHFSRIWCPVYLYLVTANYHNCILKYCGTKHHIKLRKKCDGKGTKHIVAHIQVFLLSSICYIPSRSYSIHVIWNVHPILLWVSINWNDYELVI